MKKFFALLLAGLMVFALVACTPTENPDNPDNPDVTENPDVTPEPDEPTMFRQPAARSSTVHQPRSAATGVVQCGQTMLRII